MLLSVHISRRPAIIGRYISGIPQPFHFDTGSSHKNIGDITVSITHYGSNIGIHIISEELPTSSRCKVKMIILIPFEQCPSGRVPLRFFGSLVYYATPLTAIMIDCMLFQCGYHLLILQKGFIVYKTIRFIALGNFQGPLATIHLFRDDCPIPVSFIYLFKDTNLRHDSDICRTDRKFLYHLHIWEPAKGQRIVVVFENGFEDILQEHNPTFTR